MVDIRFSRNEYTWANQGIVPAMADAVELTKTIQERALEALRAHRATLGEDTAVRIYVGSTEPAGAAHGDFWWNGDSRQRKDSWAGETSRTNLFTDQRPLEAMPNHYVTSGSMSLYLGNEIRYVMTAGGEFRAGFNITGTGTHTFAFEFRSTTVSALRSFHLRTSDGAIDRYVVLPAYEEWLRVEDTVTGPVQVYLTPEVAENPDAGDVVFIKDIIVEAGTDAGVFFDGAMPMCSWTGTPGLSTSTYTPGWALAPALSDLIAVLTQTSYQDGFVDIYLGPEIPLFPGEGDLWDDGAEFKVFDGMGWQILIDDTGTVIDETIRDRVKPIVGEIIDPVILPIKEDIDRIDDELVVVGTEVTVVSDWVNSTGAQLDVNLAQAQIDLDAAEAALQGATNDLNTLQNVTLPALDLEITTTQGELDTLANTTLPALGTRLDEAEADLTTLSSTTLPALNTQITDAQDALNAAFPSGVFNVEGALDTTITGTVIEYAVNSSETVAPTTDWSTTQPTRTPGTFVWFRTKITYGSGTTNTSSAALLTGNTGATGPEGPAGSQGIQGPPGADGVSTYTWLKYADTPTTGMSDTPAGKTYMGLAHNKPTATESSNYSDYQWSLIKGEDGIDGEPGIPGPPGEDGQTTYTWVKYADNASGGGMADLPAGKTYIGLAFNKTTATESTTATDYQWSLIQGPQGPQGNQGIQGPPGADGTQYYTWIKYADTPTTGMADLPAGKTYMGIAVNKTSPTESSTYSDYQWSLIQGPQGNQGIPGVPGDDGITYYTWIKYSASADGTNPSDDPTGRPYIGIAYNKTTQTESTVKTDYTWSLIQGPQGPQGSQGIQGPPGANGQTTYTWLKYADTPTTGMSDTPAGKTYMGLAYNKTTATESENYSDYAWSLIKGADGSDGKGISNTVVTYQVHSNGTTAPTGTWQATPQATTTGQFLWTKTETTYTDATKSTAYSVAAHGATGPGGATGAAGRGITGTTVEYQASGSGTIAPTGTWTTAIPATTPGQWLWTRTTTTFSSAPSPVLSYAVAKHGETGQQGVQGPPGADGQPTYTWIKYAPNGAPTAVQMSDSPTNMTHIGLAFNKTTATESTVPTDYQWALIQGAPGADGISITSVTPYFLQQVSATAPAKPTASPPPTPWTATEPTWVSGQNLYRTERIIYSDTSFVYTDVSKVAAYAAANAAMLAANSKNTNTYTDLVRPALPGSNPTVTGRRVGDVHRWRYTDNGEVIKEIILNASNAWQDIKFGDSVLTTLDVGKLTAGTATIQTAVIQKLTADIATIIELNADRITSGTIDSGRINTTELAATLATIIELDAGAITSGTIDTARLNATALAAQIATIIELNADRIVAGEIGAARINTTELATSLANIITANIENLRVGTGTMDTAVINKLWTDVVRSRKITTDMMVVGSGDNLVADPYFVDTELNNARAARSQGTWTRAYELPMDPSSPVVFQVSAGGTRYLRLLGVDLITERDWGSRVEPGTKYRVRYDYRRIGTVSLATVRPRVWWVNHQGTVTLDIPRAAYAGTTTSWQQDEVEWTAPATAVTAWLEIHVNAGSSGTTIQVKNPLFVSKVDPSLMVDGLISAELGLNTSGVVRAGEAKGAATELSLDGISIYTSGESTDSRSRRIHLTPYGDQSLHMVGEYEGNPVDFGFDSTGGASARVVTAAEDVYIDGKPLLGARVDPTVTEESWLDNSGLGPVAWGDLAAANPTGPVHTGSTGSATTMIGYITFPVVAGRRYRISMGYGLVPSSLTASGSRIGCHFKYSITPPGAAAPPGLLTSAATLLEVQNHVTHTQAVYGTSSFVWNCPTTGDMRLGVTLNTLYCGGHLHRGSEQAWKLYVDDIGVWSGLPDLAVAPAASPKQTYTSIWTPSSLVTYQGQNNASWGSYNGVQQVNKINQGSWETYYIQRWGVAGFLGNAVSGETSKTITSALSGATINSVKVRLNNALSDSPSVKARIGWQSTQTAVPVIQTSSAGISVGSSVTTTLPTAAHTAIAGGNRYITVGPGTTTARSEYAFFHGTTGNANQIMQLIINYTR